jgi:translation initiation factor IF-2
MKSSKLIVTICGHVNSGKTTFIEVITQIACVKREAGKITQKLTIYEVTIDTIIPYLKMYDDSIVEKIFSKTVPTHFIFLDTPGHNAFIDIKHNAFMVSDLVFIFSPINQLFSTESFNLLKEVIRMRLLYLIVFTKLDIIPNWENAAVFRLNLKRNNNNVIYERWLNSNYNEFLNENYELQLYSNLEYNSDRVNYSCISSTTKEGFFDLFLILVKEYLKVEPNSEKKKYYILDEQIGNIHYLTGILLTGCIKTKTDLVDEYNTTYRIKRLYKNPYTDLILVNELSETSIFGIEANYDKLSRIKHSSSGLIVKAKTRGSLLGLINKLKDEGWPIKSAGVGKVNTEDILMAKMSQTPFNLVIVLDKGIIKDNVIYGETIYNLVDEVRSRVKIYYETVLEKLKTKKSIAKIELLSDYVFKNIKPYVIGCRLISGFLHKDSNYISEDKNIKLKIVELQQNKTVVEYLENLQTFGAKIETENNLENILNKKIFYSHITDFFEYKDLEKILPPELWSIILKGYSPC